MVDHIDEMQRQRELVEVAASVSKFYNSLSDDEVKEQTLWGQFSETQFPRR